MLKARGRDFPVHKACTSKKLQFAQKKSNTNYHERVFVHPVPKAIFPRDQTTPHLLPATPTVPGPPRGPTHLAGGLSWLYPCRQHTRGKGWGHNGLCTRELNKPRFDCADTMRVAWLDLGVLGGQSLTTLLNRY